MHILRRQFLGTKGPAYPWRSAAIFVCGGPTIVGNYNSRAEFPSSFCGYLAHRGSARLIDVVKPASVMDWLICTSSQPPSYENALQKYYCSFRSQCADPRQ